MHAEIVHNIDIDNNIIMAKVWKEINQKIK